MNQIQLVTTLSTLLLTACMGTAPIEPELKPELTTQQQDQVEINGSIYQASTNRLFFEDIRARRAGDVINVILDERTNATKSASTNANKGTSISLPSPTLFGGQISGRGRKLLETNASANTDFNGSADSSQSNRLNGSIAVTVDSVLNNGNLWIQGQKVLTLNQGSEIVRVSGQIRPQDISPDNTVLSTQIANANITYGGKGLLSDANRAGWLTRLFVSPIWPF